MSQDHEEECSTQTQIRKLRRTNSPRFNPDEDGKRRATLMRRVHQVRTKGERIEVSFDMKGQPEMNYRVGLECLLESTYPFGYLTLEVPI
ncbi:hypothetical protein TIFTF001_021878 [Ficus carica]|uniref:Uncharacterized protein n=1 Tax=Ficus carica TaxID=3494 RepID=A0AA88ABE7_FICCA|nr:hypothetical protein TIFTF001_021878 [Ficus carica]